MNNELEKALRKIKKCLALSASSNENEAAIALKQAQSLMKKYNLNTEQVQLSEVKEKSSVGAKAISPPDWFWQLAACVSKAFSCDHFHRSKKFYDKNYRVNVDDKIVFIGLGANPEIASYVFEVLYRDLKKRRKLFIQTLENEHDDFVFSHKAILRTWRAEKIRCADIFCDSYVGAIYKTVAHFAKPSIDEKLIEEYMGVKKLSEGKHRSPLCTSGDLNIIQAGADAAKDVHLYHGVDETKQKKLRGR